MSNSWNLAGERHKKEDDTRHVADITAIMQVRRRRGQTERDKMEKHKGRPDTKSWTQTWRKVNGKQVEYKVGKPKTSSTSAH